MNAALEKWSAAAVAEGFQWWAWHSSQLSAGDASCGHAVLTWNTAQLYRGFRQLCIESSGGVSREVTHRHWAEAQLQPALGRWRAVRSARLRERNAASHWSSNASGYAFSHWLHTHIGLGNLSRSALKAREHYDKTSCRTQLLRLRELIANHKQCCRDFEDARRQWSEQQLGEACQRWPRLSMEEWAQTAAAHYDACTARSVFAVLDRRWRAASSTAKAETLWSTISMRRVWRSWRVFHALHCSIFSIRLRVSRRCCRESFEELRRYSASRTTWQATVASAELSLVQAQLHRSWKAWMDAGDREVVRSNAIDLAALKWARGARGQAMAVWSLAARDWAQQRALVHQVARRRLLKHWRLVFKEASAFEQLVSRAQEFVEKKSMKQKLRKEMRRRMGVNLSPCKQEPRCLAFWHAWRQMAAAMRSATREDSVASEDSICSADLGIDIAAFLEREESRGSLVVAEAHWRHRQMRSVLKVLQDLGKSVSRASSVASEEVFDMKEFLEQEHEREVMVVAAGNWRDRNLRLVLRKLQAGLWEARSKLDNINAADLHFAANAMKAMTDSFAAWSNTDSVAEAVVEACPSTPVRPGTPNSVSKEACRYWLQKKYLRCPSTGKRDMDGLEILREKYCSSPSPLKRSITSQPPMVSPSSKLTSSAMLAQAMLSPLLLEKSPLAPPEVEVVAFEAPMIVQDHEEAGLKFPKRKPKRMSLSELHQKRLSLDGGIRLVSPPVSPVSPIA